MIFSTERGFSLAEGMVAAGLLGIVSLAMLQGLKQDAKTKALARIEDDIQAIMATINNSIKDNAACTQTLAGLSIGSGLTNYNGSIKRPNGADLTSPINNFTAVALQASTTNEVAMGLKITSIQVGRFVRYFTLNENFESTVTGDTRLYGAAELNVTFEQRANTDKHSDNTAVTTNTVRSILVNVKATTGGVLEECVNPADLTAIQLKKQVCATPGLRGTYLVGSFDPNTGNCTGVEESLRSIGAQTMCEELGGQIGADGRCIPLGSSETCPNGIREFDSDGRAVCF